MSLSIFFHSFLSECLHYSKGDCAKMISELLGYSDRTIREWRTGFIENDFSFPDSAQGSYQRSDVLWQHEELNKKAREFVKANASIKRKKNLTAAAFCHWINEVLLHNSVLDPGFPRRVSLTTAL